MAASVIINGAAVFLFFLSNTYKTVLNKASDTVIRVNIISVSSRKRTNNINKQYALSYTEQKNHTLKHSNQTPKFIKTEKSTASIRHTKQTPLKKDVIIKKNIHKSQPLNVSKAKTKPKRASPKTNRHTNNPSNTYTRTTVSYAYQPILRRKNISFSSKTLNISNSSYANIFMWINKHKFYPVSALYKEEEGKIVLSFVINSKGTISKINISKPSKYDSLNRAALKIIASSSPIPKTLLGSINDFPAKAVINIVFRIEQ